MPASMAGEVVKVGPALVLLSEVLLRGWRGRASEESSTRGRLWPPASNSDLDEGTGHNQNPTKKKNPQRAINVHEKNKSGTNHIPASLLPRPRPFPVMTTISISSWGISETFCRNAFSRALAINTMSSAGWRGRQDKGFGLVFFL